MDYFVCGDVMYGVPILMRVLVGCLDMCMIRFGVERELVGFCRICCDFIFEF